MTAKLNIDGSIGIYVNHFIMLQILYLRRTCTLDQENPVLGIRVLILKSYIEVIFDMSSFSESIL